MANYEIKVSKSALKKLKSIPKQDVQSIVSTIESLSIEPYPPGARKLRGEPNTFRVRSGNYRIIYEIKDTTLIILVLKVGHRKDVYR